MKRQILKLVCAIALPLFFTACKTPVAQQSGKEDMAYLLFVSPKEYAGKEVYLAIQCVSEDIFVFMLDDITVNKPVSSVAENAVAMLSLYPNPATDMIVISSGGSEIESVDIYNAAGAMIYSSQASDGNSFRYNVSSLDAGIYFAKVATSDGTKVMRFIVR